MKNVFIHALGQTTSDWHQVIQQLDSSECITLTLFPDDEGILTYERVYQHLEEKLNQIDAPFHLCGLSLGGRVSLDYASRYPERLAGLIVSGARYTAAKGLSYKLQLFILRFLAGKSFVKNYGKSKQSIISLMKSLGQQDMTAQLAQITLPTLVIVADKDTPYKQEALDLVEELPDAELVVIDEGTHLLNESHPVEMANVIIEFTKVRN